MSANLQAAVRRATGTAIAAGFLAVLPLPGVAQQGPTSAPDIDEIVVTGSRIRGVEAVGSAVIAIDRQEIRELGAATTGDLLRELPQVQGLGASETASGAQNAAANVTRSLSVNLRGIGSNATLLLLNGRRLPAAGTQGQIADASVIPSLAIERLEVVADGGSAIYGSDAVTGVVSMITRRQFTGQESSGRYGFADGYSEFTLGHIAGFSWSSGRAMAALEHSEHTALEGRDRSFYTSDHLSAGGTDRRAQQCNPGTIVVGGVPYAIPAGGVTPATASTLVAGTRNLCDNLPRGDIIPELERNSILVNAEQQLGDAVTLFAEGFYSRREFVLQDSGIVSNLTVPSTNPFYVNPTGGTGPVTVQYDFINDGGLPRNPGYAESWQGVVGLRYDFSSDWQGQVHYSYGESSDEVSRRQNLNSTPAGINAYLANPNPAVAFNPFGSSANNPTTIAAVRNGQFVIQGDTSLMAVAAQVDGPLFEVSGGPVRLAAGVEYREEKLGGLLQSGSTTAPVLVPNSSGRDVKAIFAEVFLPVFGGSDDAAGHGSLDLSIAGRYEEYSDFGSTLNPKFGFVWRPAGALAVRGSWGTSFRAPGLAENDPRSGGYGLYGDTLPCNHRPPATSCIGIGIAGGNADLTAEEADTWSIGFDYNPAWLPGFNLSLSYFDIDYQNQIVGLRGTAGLLTNPIYAQFRILDPTAEQVTALLTSGLPVNSPINAALVTYIQDGRRQNLGGTIVQGFDFGVRQVWETQAGRFTAGVTGSYLTELETSVAPGAPFVNVRNTINNPLKLRARGSLGWSRGDLSAGLAVNHAPAYDESPVVEIDSYTTVDLYLGADLGERTGHDFFNGLKLSLNVSNLFDESPPFSDLNIAGYDSQVASPVGRLVALSISKDW
jgi:iron complex outermembrane receptor protein